MDADEFIINVIAKKTTEQLNFLFLMMYSIRLNIFF